MVDGIDIEDIQSEREDEATGPVEYEIASYPADFTLQGLFDKWEADQLQLPKFQRQFVWKIYQSSRLIESFLLGLPVPPVFLYKDKTSQKLVVIDGQQRLLSVFFFFNGNFKEEKVFRLQGLRTKWEGSSYDSLSGPDKLRLQDSVLRAIIVNQLDPKDNTSIYHVFERLNTGGTQLSNQEVRNCLYWGGLNDLLNNINNFRPWREILGKLVIDPRQKDIELIVRLLSLHYDVDSYKKPMKQFLNDFMYKYRSPEAEVLIQFEKLFKVTCSLIYDELKQKPFHIHAGLNAAVLDSVFVAFSHNLESKPENLKERYESLKSNTEFQRVIKAATTDVEIIKERLKIAEETLFR
jgi:hypothetical protein